MADRNYRILLDGRWSLEDLTTFSRIYFQNYSFIYCLEKEVVRTASLRTESVLRQYELRHGLSYVNIYDIFRSHVEKQDRPQITSISYASPGWIELALNLETATQFAKVLAIYLGAPVAVATTYKKLHKIFIDLNEQRKKHELKSLKLDAQKAVEAQNLSNELAEGLGFESLNALNEHTKDVEESSKLMLAHYRRVSRIAKFVQDGKASFPYENDDWQ
ncbi:MAG: hypothetical protein AAF542_00115 [Pseudomonadota bacterium]